jgi:hypothetical protein
MKSLEILLTLLDEAHLRTCASMDRDKSTILSRYEHEGESFLGITLPAFSEWLTMSLREGCIATSIYARFRKRPKRISVLPCFLHGLTSRVFNAQTGLLLEHPDANAVFFIQQICLFYKKVFKVCDPERDLLAKKAYKETDDSLRRLPEFSQEKAAMLDNVCRRFFPKIDVAFRAAIDDESILPKHGPGATADKAWANGKYKGRDFYKRWDDLFSWEELYGFSTIHQSNREFTVPRSEQPVKVVSVPKTMKTSRIICVEPTAMQYAQQLTALRLIRSVQRVGLYKHLNFYDQRPNQEAARVGSVLGNLATIDLSEASDRVTVKLTSIVFRHSPLLLRHLYGCRSTRAMMPDGSLIRLRKYASMGSALTFPVEAICFLMVCIAAICDERKVFNRRGIPKSLRAFDECRKDVLVFGDDIIVPTDCIERVAEYLEAFGLKVNSKKTFSKGGFRESCGHDYFRGVYVTPTYLRQDPPQSLRNSRDFVSWVHMSNRFYKAGLWHTADAVRGLIDKIYRLPLVRDTCAGLGWHTHGEAAEARWTRNKNGFDSYRTTTLVVGSRKISDELEGYDRLLHFHLNRGEGDEYLSDPTRSPKRNSLKLRQRKVLPW